MANVNIFACSGNLTDKARVATTGGGFSTAEFCIANNKRKKDKEGNWYDAANFLDCVIRGEQALSVGPKLKRGDHVSVTGRVETDTYEDKEGKKRKSWKVVVDKVDFIARKDMEDEDIEF